MKKVGICEPPLSQRFLEVTGMKAGLSACLSACNAQAGHAQAGPEVPPIESLEARYQRLRRASIQLELATRRFEGVRRDIRRGAAVLFWVLALNLILVLVNLVGLLL